MTIATAGDVRGDEQKGKKVVGLDSATIRFVGDSGDGMQLAGTQFTNTSAVFGNDVSTYPDFPAEIRAPAGTLAGVSGFQINFSDHEIHTPGDKVNALIAMNPAALKTNLADLEEGGLLVVNTDGFTKTNLKKAHYDSDPLEDGSVNNYRVFKVPITTHTLEAVKETGLSAKDSARCKNFYALGLIFWLYERPLTTTLDWIDTKFARKPDVAQANALAVKAGHAFGETAEMFSIRYRVKRAKLPKGIYRNLTGNQAAALGLITAARLAGKPLFYGTYPITPASDILHELSLRKNFDVRTFQAEDEIAAYAAALGAAFAGALAATASSGPGIALKQEGIGLGVMIELPTIIINVQRGGPSTGLPTKVEQSDLWQAIVGRNGECPVPVLAPYCPSDCFWTVIEAARWAIKYMTPVMVLSDGFLASSSEPWLIPDPAKIPPIPVTHPTDAAAFQPYLRDEHGARPWAIPGTPGLEHRIGGLEKADVTGNVNYDPENHHKMVGLRAKKVNSIVADIPDQKVFGDESGELLLISWGGTFGAVRSAVAQARDTGYDVSHVHLRHLHPMPSNVGEILTRFKHVIACELNMGQLQQLLRSKYVCDVKGLHKMKGRPFMISEIIDTIKEVLGETAS